MEHSACVKAEMAKGQEAIIVLFFTLLLAIRENCTVLLDPFWEKRKFPFALPKRTRQSKKHRRYTMQRTTLSGFLEVVNKTQSGGNSEASRIPTQVRIPNDVDGLRTHTCEYVHTHIGRERKGQYSHTRKRRREASLHLQRLYQLQKKKKHFELNLLYQARRRQKTERI